MSADDLMIEGIESLTEGNYSEALNYFQRSLEQDQNLPECNYYKGLTHQLLSQFKISVESFDIELKINPSHINSLIAKGTFLCLLSRKEEGINVKVVSMPSMFLFDKQNNNYKEEVLPSNMKNKTMAIEMGSTMPWYKYANYVYGIDEFGKSMPISEIFNYYGFTVDNLKNVFKKNFNI